VSNVSMSGLPVTGAQFRIGGVLSKTFSVYWRQFWRFLLLGLIPLIPALIFGMIYGSLAAFHQVGVATHSGAANGLTAAQVLLQFSAQGAAIYGTFQTLQGQPFTLGQSLTIGFRRLLVMLGVVILAGLAGFFAALLFVIPGIIVGCMLYVALPASIIEKRGVFGSLSRSAALTKGHRWAIFGLWLLIGAVALVFVLLIMIPLVGTLGHRPQEASAVTLGLVGLSAVVLALVIQVFVSIFAIVLVTVVYRDLRAVKEGIGPEGLATVFD
jgi:hypothetical protein